MSRGQVSTRKLTTVFWSALIIKLMLATFLPLTNDEAYYWVWSQHMQWSFYDHPPVVAWLFWLGNQINWYGSMVRWPGILLGHATLALWLLILRPLFTVEQCLYWLMLAMFSPLMGGTNLIVTPDLPLLFFYALSLLAFYQWRENPVWRWSLAFGFAMGLGFSSKYMMLMFPLSIFPLILLSRKMNGPFLRQSGFILLGLIAGTLPVWMWNILNDYQSLRFQINHGLGHDVWKPSWTIEYILAQIGLIFPLILYWALRARNRLPLVYHLIAWVPLLFFLITTARGYSEANWPIVAYPAIFALAVASMPHGRKAFHITIYIWAGLLTLLAGIILIKPTWSKPLKFREFYQFDNVIEKAKGLDPLYARSYQMAAKMNFELKHPVYKLKGMNRRDFYDFLEISEPHTKSFYLAVEKGDELPLLYSGNGYKVAEVIPVDDHFEIWRVQTQ